MKFSRVKDTKLNIEYDWLADISSLEDLSMKKRISKCQNGQREPIGILHAMVQ